MVLSPIKIKTRFKGGFFLAVEGAKSHELH